MDEEGTVGFEHQEPDGFWETGRKATCVVNLAAGDK
jgi:hypothetical protein